MRRILRTCVRQGAGLPPHELWLLLRIAGLVCVFPLLQRLLPLPTLLHVVDARPRSRAASPPVKRLIALTRGLLHQRIGLFRPNCVTQSLVLFHFLRQGGHPVRLHFGVRKDGDDLAGHCWVERAEIPLAEPADPRRTFTPVYAFPEADVPHG